MARGQSGTPPLRWPNVSRGCAVVVLKRNGGKEGEESCLLSGFLLAFALALVERKVRWGVEVGSGCG